MSKVKNLWGGRFSEAVDTGFAEFNRSFPFDRRLLGVDVRASIAYCEALKNAHVLTDDEARRITAALHEVQNQAETKAKYINDESEDVHSFVEACLVDLIGPTGLKLHTGRSRNDQVATDLRLWLRDALDYLNGRVVATQEALLDFAAQHSQTVIPGYTHLQRAQPILLAHWCLAYFEMLSRDRERLSDARKHLNVLPLGSAALAGTSFAIDRAALARDLGFAEVSRNSLDAVSDRDFCVEFANACALIMVHLSRLAEDIVIYATSEFGFFELSDAVATGSSLMPQKKNPDSMELVRGKAGRVFGHVIGLLATLKALPLAYNKDMQEDKEAVFDCFDTTSNCLEVTATVLRNTTITETRAREAASHGYMNATELADYLVGKGMPFRQAHETVGQIVVHAIKRRVELQELPIDDLRAMSTLIDADVFAVLSVDQTLGTKSQVGGTAPPKVSEALAAARQSLLE
ncbi:MAG: argininosuccinate lyase [Pyrinomonadaceae bacterium]